MKTRGIKEANVLLHDRSRRVRSIELHIGELVLHGFSHSDRQSISESIQRELRTLLHQKDFSNQTSFQIDQINAESFPLESPQQSKSAGVKIARAIYGGLR